VKGTKWALGFAMLILGLLLTTQYRVTQLGNTGPEGLRAEELAVELKGTKDRLKAAENENDKLKAEIEKLTKAGTGVVAVPQRDPNMELLAGTVAARGSGVIVTLTQEPDATAKTRIRDEDLWLVMNELKAAGAEGLAINGQRVTAITGVREVGQRVMVNQTMTSSPFQVAATGDPGVLETALKLRGGVIDRLKPWGIKVTIVRSDAVELPGFGSVPTFQFTKPVR